MIGRIQWAIAAVVVVHGIGLVGALGTTGVVFVALGLLYCGVAAVAMRETMRSLAVALVADALLAAAAFKVLAGAVTAVPVNAHMIGRSPGPLDFVTLDTVGPALVLLLITALWMVFALARGHMGGRRRP